MELLTFLGTASAIPDINHENSHLLVQSGKSIVLVDCPGNPIVRIREAGLDPKDISDLVLTHFHPDHVSGLPLLIMDLWLLGRTQMLTIYGLQYTLARAKSMLDLFNWSAWPEMYPLRFVKVQESNAFPLFERDDLNLYASPGTHLIPTIGLRFEFPKSGKKLVYTSDGEPCPAMQALAMNVDILIHEAAGEGFGHSSARQCGQVAQVCNVDELHLIHYPTETPVETLVALAKENFSGRVFVAQDFNKILLA